VSDAVDAAHGAARQWLAVVRAVVEEIPVEAVEVLGRSAASATSPSAGRRWRSRCLRVSATVLAASCTWAWASHISHSSPKVAPARWVTPASAAAAIWRSVRSASALGPRTLRVA
jgi:hypothetical protein